MLTLFVLCDVDFYNIVIMRIVGLWRCIPAEVSLCMLWVIFYLDGALWNIIFRRLNLKF